MCHREVNLSTEMYRVQNDIDTKLDDDFRHLPHKVLEGEIIIMKNVNSKSVHRERLINATNLTTHDLSEICNKILQLTLFTDWQKIIMNVSDISHIVEEKRKSVSSNGH
jgi:hypothetical protein